jgi:quercetin dioxygenase-like cupin family protein/alkylhydroperoxidase/carboxymuconolactone decarboxylase family protein YurZ
MKLISLMVAMFLQIGTAAAEQSTPVAPTTMRAIAPALADYTDKILLGDVWKRPGLSPRDRSLVTISTLAAIGENDELATQLKYGLANGLTRGQIGEVLTQLAFYAGWPRATAAAAVATNTLAQVADASPETGGKSLRVVHPDANPVQGPSDHFIGKVTLKSRYQVTGGARLGGATVAFQPGARTNWHSHPFGQLLIVTAGRGWVQAEGGPVETVNPGDVVWTPPGVKHWHGATRTSSMTHIAVSEAQEGSEVQWLAPVTEAEYQAPR